MVIFEGRVHKTFPEPLTLHLKNKGVMKRIIFTVGLFLCWLFVYSYCAATLVVFNNCEECSSVQVVVTVPATAEDSSYDVEKTLGNWGNSVAFDTPHSGTYMMYANCLLGESGVTWEFDRSVEIRNEYSTKESFLNCYISPTTTTSIFPEYYSISGRITGDIFSGVSMMTYLGVVKGNWSERPIFCTRGRFMTESEKNWAESGVADMLTFFVVGCFSILEVIL